MVEVPLTQGKVALVDDEDAERVLAHKWVYQHKEGSCGYATRRGKKYEGCTAVRLHRFILNAPPGVHVDHINGNGLDNRKENLRFATRVENARNKRIHRNNTSGYKGVRRRYEKWVAEITANRTRFYLGTYHSPEEVGRAYDASARKHHGKFARLNFPNEHGWTETEASEMRRAGRTSKYRGVSFDSERKKWVAQLKHRGQHYSLGRFGDEIAAARAYDMAALLLHGEFARINFPEKSELIRRMLEGIDAAQAA